MFALIELQVKGRYCRTDLLSSAEILQLQLRESLQAEGLDQLLVFFNVTRVQSLRMPDGTFPQLSNIEAMRRRGSVIQLYAMEVNQVQRPGIPAEDILD